MTIFVYNENCILAGRKVSRARLDDPESSGEDWHEEDVSEDNYERHLEIGGQYHRRIATSISDSMQ